MSQTKRGENTRKIFLRQWKGIRSHWIKKIPPCPSCQASKIRWARQQSLRARLGDVALQTPQYNPRARPMSAEVPNLLDASHQEKGRRPFLLQKGQLASPETFSVHKSPWQDLRGKKRDSPWFLQRIVFWKVPAILSDEKLTFVIVANNESRLEKFQKVMKMKWGKHTRAPLFGRRLLQLSSPLWLAWKDRSIFKNMVSGPRQRESLKEENIRVEQNVLNLRCLRGFPTNSDGCAALCALCLFALMEKKEKKEFNESKKWWLFYLVAKHASCAREEWSKNRNTTHFSPVAKTVQWHRTTSGSITSKKMKSQEKPKFLSITASPINKQICLRTHWWAGFCTTPQRQNAEEK